MLKLSVLLLVGTWLSFPGDFLHQNSHSCCPFLCDHWHRPGAPNDQFVVKCIIPPLMKIKCFSVLLGKYYLFLFPSKTHKKFPSQLDKIGWFPSQLIKFISQPGIKLININERNNNDDNNNNTYINVAKCNLGKVNLETMLVCSFSCYTRGDLITLAGAPRDLYTQLLDRLQFFAVLLQ